MTRMFLVFFLSLFITSCAGVFKRHHAYRTDFDPIEHQRNQNWYQNNSKQVDQSMMELGFSESRQLTKTERNVLANRLLLKKYEQKLQTKLEKEQYFKYKPYIPNDAKRIEFLSLSTYPERELWLKRNGVAETNRNYKGNISHAIQSQDIVPYMPMDAVIRSWGEPDIREISGNPIYGNEKWRYIEYESTPAGFRKKEKFVYFEQGLVHAWQAK